MCPTIGGIDSGELATVQATLSIAHPTGYPLFTLLGYLFLKLPLPFEIIVRLNLLATIWSVLAVIILIRTSRLVLFHLSEIINDKWKYFIRNDKSNKYIIILASSFPGLMFGFSLTFWSQSSYVEVYSLQMFLMSLIIFFSIRAYFFHHSFDFLLNKTRYLNNWFWTFVVIGLGFANHLMTIFIVFPTVFLFLSQNKLNFKSIRSLFYLLSISFAVSLIFYLWMMFHSASNLPFKYGDPSNLYSLIDHITGQRYRNYMFQGINSIKIQAENFINSLQINFLYQKWGEFSISIILGMPGIIFLAILQKKLFYYLGLIIVFTLAISFNYSISDIKEYFLPVFYIISLSSCVTMLLISLILPKGKIIVVLLFIFTFLFIGFEAYCNYKFADKSHDYYFENYAKSYLESLPRNAILYTDNWGLMLSPMLYLQNIKNIRRDVLIFSPQRMVCFTPYQSLNIKRFINNKKLIMTDNTFIVDLDKNNDFILQK
jgi:hypothetical protein